MLLCQLYAVVFSVGLLVQVIQHPHQPGGPVGWFFAGAWPFATVSMLLFRRAVLLRIGLYVACALTALFIALCEIAGAARAPGYVEQLAKSACIDALTAFACIPLLLGLAVRIFIQKAGDATPENATTAST